MSFQMGLNFTDVERQYEQYLKNSTKCNKWSDVKRSHLDKGRRVLSHLHVLGIMVLLAVGLGASVFIVAAETLGFNSQRRRLQAAIKECPPPPPPSPQDTPQIYAELEISHQSISARLDPLQERRNGLFGYKRNL